MANIQMPGSKEIPEEIEDPVEAELEAEENEEGPFDDEGGFDGEFQALADVPSDTEVWGGGPTAGVMLQWMQDYNKAVYVTSISFEEHIAWRPLKRSEYAEISNQIESIAGQVSESEISMLNEELICKKCVLYPDYSEMNFDDVLAGIPTLISQQILERSGFTAISTREMV